MDKAKILLNLYEAACDNLSVDQLEVLSNLENQVVLDIENLSTSLNGIAGLVRVDSDNRAGNFQDSEEVSNLLQNVSNQLSEIQGWLEVSQHARDRFDSLGVVNPVHGGCSIIQH